MCLIELECDEKQQTLTEKKGPFHFVLSYIPAHSICRVSKNLDKIKTGSMRQRFFEKWTMIKIDDDAIQ